MNAQSMGQGAIPTQVTETNIEPLIYEYISFVSESLEKQDDPESVDWEHLESRLCTEGEWTLPAAQAVITLARDNSSFMLRNALALSVALEIEDGEVGF